MLKFSDADPGSGMEKIRIVDLGMEKIGSGINIPDPQHWFLLELSSFKLNQRVLYGSFQLIKCIKEFNYI
jgi:hypothetical protein